MATSIKISQLPAKGSNLEATDLLEISEFNGTGYVTKSITGAEIVAGATTGYVPETRTLTINGTTQDLSADRTFTISTGITIGTTAITSGTVGRVLFEGTGNVVQESTNLFWDNTNGRLGIRTSTPSTALHVRASNSSTGIISVVHANDASNFGARIQLYDAQSGEPTVDGANGLALIYTNNTGTSYLWNYNNGPLLLGINNGEAFRIASTTRNVLINTTTDAGYKLDVNGTARVQDNVFLTNGIIANTTGTTRLQGSTNYFTHNRLGSSGTLGFQIAQTNTLSSFWRWSDATDAVEFGNARNAPVALFTNNTEKMRIVGGGNVLINTTTDAGYKLDVNGTARVVNQATIQTLTIGLGGGAVATNTALGLNALTSNTTGANNTSVGSGSLRANTIGDYNTSIGLDALRFNTGGGQNTAVGWRALNSVLTGYGNVAVGSQALISTTGGFNIGIGERAGESNTTGTYNICIGAQTQTGDFSNSVILGRSATATASNQFVVGTATYNVGSVTTEVNTSTQVWNVIINGVARKILLA